MTEKIKKSLDFVVRHYRPGAFRKNESFFRDALRIRRRRRLGIAAAAAGVLAASAAIYTYVSTPEPPAPVPMPAAAPAPAPAVPDTACEVKRMEFSDAPLTRVVEEIENMYGVKVEGLAPDDTNRLTLSYEGTADDLVATINELLGTNLTIKE